MEYAACLQAESRATAMQRVQLAAELHIQGCLGPAYNLPLVLVLVPVVVKAVNRWTDSYRAADSQGQSKPPDAAGCLRYRTANISQSPGSSFI